MCTVLPVPQISAHSTHLRMDSGVEYWDTINLSIPFFFFFLKKAEREERVDLFTNQAEKTMFNCI